MKLTQKKQRKPFRGIAFLLGLLLLVGGGVFAAQVLRDSPEPVTTQQTATQPVVKEAVPPAVSPEKPTRIVIDKLGVDAEIIPLGLTKDGAMDAPSTNHQVGWYNQSAQLGTKKYATLLDGHYGTDKVPAVFYRLSEVAKGDSIVLVGERGVKVTYKVVEIERQYFEDVDMRKALYPYREDVESLTIITCDGDYDQRQDTYDKRFVVYAEKVTG